MEELRGAGAELFAFVACVGGTVKSNSLSCTLVTLLSGNVQ